MSIVTLTTDWGLNSYYVSALKGRLLSRFAQAVIVDINHDSPRSNITKAAFTIKHSYKNFPKGTIHIIGVNQENFESLRFLVAKCENQFFIAADNGIVSLIFEDTDIKVVLFETFDYEIIPTFPELSIFSHLAGEILNGKDIEQLGKITTNYRKQIQMQSTVDKSAIIAKILYTDNYGNVIVNVSFELFQQIGNKRKFTIFVNSNKNKINTISPNYYDDDVTDGDLMAIFNSIDLLEIAIRNGNAQELLGLTKESTIRINFYD